MYGILLSIRPRMWSTCTSTTRPPNWTRGRWENLRRRSRLPFQELGVFPASTSRIPLDIQEPMPFDTVQAIENAKRNAELGRVPSPPLDTLSAESQEANLSALQAELQQALRREIAA